MVIHLRALISGQAHHMEHIVQTLGQKSNLVEHVEQGFSDSADDLEDIAEESPSSSNSRAFGGTSRSSSRTYGKRSVSGAQNETSPEMESTLFNANPRNSKRYSNMSIIDVADRHLREKTNDIADIIRNISAQCAAAVEGLQLAHDAEIEAEEYEASHSGNRTSNLSVTSAASDNDDGRSGESDAGDDSLLQPHENGRPNSIPPTPDLIHNRSSTAMSTTSTITTPERSSQQWNLGRDHEVPTKIVEDDDEELTARSDNDLPADQGREPLTKVQHESLMRRPAGARISALGGH